MSSEVTLPPIDNNMNNKNTDPHSISHELSLKEVGDNKMQTVSSEKGVNPHKSESKNLNDVAEDMIPDELLFCLTHSDQLLPKKKRSNLGPVKESKTPEKLKMNLKKGPPANLWHHKGRRTHFKHLVDFPRSLGKGVGTRDISFLYDVAHHHDPSPPSPSKLDKSSIRLQPVEDKKSLKMALPDTIIPEEYHLVKTKAVMGLEFIDGKDTTLASDADKFLRVFPSLQPNKRFEVLQLLETLEGMLEKSGFKDESVEVKGPTQIHNLLELIKKEQNIYDLIFSEVIRQVSVDCIERGKLLSQLRQNYADLLNRIPRQIQSLHAEVMAQRSLDRRLTEELSRFKTSISFLTKELQSVRQHDHQVTVDAHAAEEELAKALKESQTNANLVDEYHSLYELQRKRLEATVSNLAIERDLWSNAAYNLALKITSTNSLHTAKRLHICEKAWSKLASHYTVMLNDHDCECLTEIQHYVERWRSTMFQFQQELERIDKQTIGGLQKIRDGFLLWKQRFDDCVIHVMADARHVREPSAAFVEELSEFFKNSEDILGAIIERFAGDVLLGNEEKIASMKKNCDAWTEVAWNIYRRHRSDDDKPYPLSETMQDVNERFHKLSKQLHIRFTGENGLAKKVMTIQNVLDNWTRKITLHLLDSEPLKDSDWLLLYERFTEYADKVSDAINLVGSQQLDDERVAEHPHQHIKVDDVMTEVKNWMKATVNQIEAEDGKLMAKVSTIHISLVRWMVHLLLNLVPNFEKSKRGSMVEPSMATIWSVEELVENAHTISETLTEFTNYAWQCCCDIVRTTMQMKKDHGDDDASHEYKDFLRLKAETIEWIRNCEFLLKEIIPKCPPILTPTLKSKLQLPQDELGNQAKLSDMDTVKSTDSNQQYIDPVQRSQDKVKEGQVKQTATPDINQQYIYSAQRIQDKVKEGQGKQAATPDDIQQSIDSALRSQDKVKEEQMKQAAATDSNQKSIDSAQPGQESVKKEQGKQAATLDNTQQSIDSALRSQDKVNEEQMKQAARAVKESDAKVEEGDVEKKSYVNSGAENITLLGPKTEESSQSAQPKVKDPSKKAESQVLSHGKVDLVASNQIGQTSDSLIQKSHGPGIPANDSGRENAQKDESLSETSSVDEKSQKDGRAESAKAFKGHGRPSQRSKKKRKTGEKAKKTETYSEEDHLKRSEEENTDVSDTSDDEANDKEKESKIVIDQAKIKPVQRKDRPNMIESEDAQDATESEKDPKKGLIRYNKLGNDENIHIATLESVYDTDNQDHLPRPTSSLMQSAYEAIAKMDSLQHELLSTEIRAQTAEKQVIDLQEQLNRANEKIRGLEKSVSNVEGTFQSASAVPQQESPIKEQTAISNSLDKVKPAENIEDSTSATNIASGRGSAKGKGKTQIKPRKSASGKKK